MGRGRGKAKKLTGATSHKDPGSGNEEPLPQYKRRGRPQKPLNDDIHEEKVANIEEEGNDPKISTPTKETKDSPAVENGKRRRRQPMEKDNSDSVVEVEENGYGLSSVTTDESVKKNGFRQNGSRRKSKPRRAAEAGVDFK